jgi:hypothetical protein
MLSFEFGNNYCETKIKSYQLTKKPIFFIFSLLKGFFFLPKSNAKALSRGLLLFLELIKGL